MRILGWFALNWLALAGLYLAFAGQDSTAELAVATSVGLAVTAYHLVTSRFGRAFSSGLIDAVALSPRIFLSVCRDVGKLTFAFLKLIVTAGPPHGSFLDIDFDPGHGDPPSRHRRSLVVTGISFAPNTYVVAVRHPQRRITLHALVAASQPRDMQWPL